MNEIDTISILLKPLGFSLEVAQPYVSGERYLMAGGKLVLAGIRDADETKVIIKASREISGKKEIASEKKSRDLMRSLSFADRKIMLPEEYHFGMNGEYVFLIMRFIPQEKVFTAHTIEEQFFIALSAFEAQESFHATTYEHMRAIKEVFPVLSSADYVRDFERMRDSILSKHADKSLRETLAEAGSFLTDNSTTIDRHANYLTHTDFVPHNFRISEHTLFMLDCVPNYATIHFGNKYEGWARFINYMMIYNPELERLLVEYVRNVRGEDEYLSLRLMRTYKITFLLEFYSRSLDKTVGDLHALTLARNAYWREALIAVLEDRSISRDVTERYIATRNTLRSEEEIARQKEFNLV